MYGGRMCLMLHKNYVNGYQSGGLTRLKTGDNSRSNHIEICAANYELVLERSTAGNFRLRIEGNNFGGNETTSVGGDATDGKGVEVSIGYRLCAPIVTLTHKIIECMVQESEGGINNGIRVVIAGRFSSGSAEGASTDARVSFSKPVIQSIEGWPMNGMPTAGGKNITIIGRNFGLEGKHVTRKIKIGQNEYTAEAVQLIHVYL